jgi:crotonobetainyl-CoA:carnitine CoA-transferase CaiB-like acyl-CoA transferase
MLASWFNRIVSSAGARFNRGWTVTTHGARRKQKYLYTSNKLQEARHELQDVRVQLQRHRKAILKELGSDEALERALSSVDDPNAAQWKGRATQVTYLSFR